MNDSQKRAAELIQIAADLLKEGKSAPSESGMEERPDVGEHRWSPMDGRYLHPAEKSRY